MSDGWIHVQRPDGRTVHVRRWHVGDGMSCSHAHGRYNVGCEAPAVVLRTPREHKGPMTQRVCPRHFVMHFWPGGVTSPTVEAHRRARAELQAAYRDEYQRLFEESLAVLIGECVAAIPEGLRHSLGPEVAAHLAELEGTAA